MIFKRYIPIAIAISFGLLTLIGLLMPLPPLSDLLLNWAAFLAAVALILGVLNLFAVHLSRLFSGRNLYSGVLVLSMLLVFALAITDSQAIPAVQTSGGVATVFNWVQAPLEAALASLLAFFLLFAGFRLLQRQRNGWSILFLLTALLMLLSNALMLTTLLPTQATTLIAGVQDIVNDIFVTAGMRGILIGVALGTITLSIRLLIGLDRPYSQ